MNADVWQMPPRPADAIRQYGEAADAMAADPSAFSLDPGTLNQRLAERDSGPLPDGLARMAIAAHTEGRLNPLGRRTIGAMLMALARGRQRQATYLQDQPGIAQRPIRRPVFIVGGWRTGTTLLHRLLAHVAGLRAPRYWELSNPFAANEADPEKRSKLVGRAQAMHDFQYSLNPTKQIVHPSGADLPEECVVAMGKDGLNWALTATAWMPSYAAWLQDQDFTGSYQRHREILQIIQGETPQRWLLKAPAHSGELAALLKVYPDAHIIHLHRDVVETVTSGASLFAVFHATYSDHIDAEAIGTYQLETLALWFQRAMAARNDAPATANIVDVSYKDLVAAPLATARGILAAVDHDCTDTDQAGMTDYLASNQQHKILRHAYSPAQFGLDPGMVREKFVDYSRRFGV
ncbi:MAG: sulfotransferase [Alphaproteobacteria bacterium]|nr:sulfotransferase [Alphaproteobacteria bacterium]